MTDHDIDLTITKIETRKPNVGGDWVSGTINDEYRFQALVFADHAECEEYELGKSKISKLWIQRMSDRATVFNWDRGADVPAADATTQAIVDFLCAGLAEHTFAE